MNPIVSKFDTQMAFLNFTISQVFLMVPPTNKSNYICLNGDTNPKVGGEWNIVSIVRQKNSQNTKI